MALPANHPTPLAAVGVTGLGVMGRNLARNLARHGYVVAIHNRSVAKTEALLADYGHEGQFLPARTMAEFVAELDHPRVVIIMVNAGPATDAVLDELVPLLAPGDIVIDAGNSHFTDTVRREQALKEKGLLFMGTGVSGGEVGALEGPSIMPGGPKKAYRLVGRLLETISAHVDGVPCCTYIGPGGAGHFVKMVHNGIEYADMQLIAEAYDLLRHGLDATPGELADVFVHWNRGVLESYLIEITAEVLRQTDAVTGQALVDVVLDQAGQKGTGRWTVQNALDLGVPITAIAEATFARGLSGAVAARAAGAGLPGHTRVLPVEGEASRQAFIEDVRQALYASKIVAYAQGLEQVAAASAEYGWKIDRGALARIWRGGCIIRARFLNRITEAYERDADLPLLLADPYFLDEVSGAVKSWRTVVVWANMAGVPVPAFASSLAYYDAIRAPRLPAALIQAQRDFFGAHTYRRADRPGVFHTDWSGDRTEHPVSE
ncbi:MAG: NADP-dependent phosphogluconate dehydrogenase [Bifidobacteriaceae bacterium]|jgi:6-phosphogluconate dehydrogenase|nr:NADP-dependent phosphogluconate dehydrogenase [Bifidobacteriaceae bacterium]